MDPLEIWVAANLAPGNREIYSDGQSEMQTEIWECLKAKMLLWYMEALRLLGMYFSKVCPANRHLLSFVSLFGAYRYLKL